MGKIRVKTIGVEEEEEKQAKLQKKRAEQKKLLRQDSAQAEKKAEAVSEEVNQAPTDSTKETPKEADSKNAAQEKKPMVKKTKGGTTKKSRSEKYQSVVSLVDKNKVYSLKEALELLPKLKVAKFDETVELHINTAETGISGTITLPHGSGKSVKVAVADDAIIDAVASGKIDFDILVATPQMMPKLAKVAKILGPKGLMPNPKNGTVTANPAEVVKKFEGGQMRYKTEAKNPIIHVAVGKVSFGDSKLSENIKSMLTTVGTNKMKKVVLKSTMSPAIKLDFTAIK
jgi:large subunit ribosomal protein L1